MHKLPTREVLHTLSLIFTIALMSCDFGSYETCSDSSCKGSLSWSPDGTKIAFRSDGRVHVMNADGTGRIDLTEDWEMGWSSADMSHSWSPDGTKIAFSYDFGVHVINVDGTGKIEYLTDGSYPSWSPDGAKIAFSRSAWQSGRGGVHTMDADGRGNAKHLVDGYAPSWSPDGTKIAFLRGCGFEQDSVWVMNADGTNEKLLAK